MKLTPLFDRVVLKQLVAEETTKSGIVLPGSGKRANAAGRGNRGWSWRSGRWKRNHDAGKGWR